MKLTIITVCFNAADDLKKTLDSILTQTFTDFEYLVVDGASKDNTLTLLESYKPLFAKESKVFRYVSEPDKGTYDAMNKGIRLAKGEWINYMNAGDSFYKDSTLYEFFSASLKENAGVMYGDTFQTFDFGSGIAREEDYKKDNTIMPFCHQSCFVKTELMRQFTFNQTYRIVADHDLFYRLREKNIVFKYIPIVVARYNGQYGLSATHPLTLHLEILRIHHINEKWYYPFKLIWTYMRYGWVQPFKNHMPRWMTDAWMKRKRKFINKN